MDKFEQILTESDRKKIIGKNKRAIKAALKDVDHDTLKLYTQLIDDAASYACAIYQSLIKQLTGLLPSEDEKAVAAELMEFIRTA